MDGWMAIVYVCMYVCMYVCLTDNGGLVSGWGLVWDEERRGGEGCWCYERKGEGKGRGGEGGYDVWCGCL